jgi:3-hydroxyacyl-CoA dehydrogenase
LPHQESLGHLWGMQLNHHVTLDKRGAVAVVTIDNPPVNALSTPVRTGLMAAIEAVNADASIRAAVLTATGRTFIAGADIGEMERPLEAPFLPDVIAALAQSAKPWAAALFGNVLGGGLEIALACRMRIAQDSTIHSTMLGFPEVRLGLIPGASGTQRLLRMTDFATAAQLVTSGKPIPADQALRLGLIDKTVATDPVSAAITLIESGAMSDARRFPAQQTIEARPAAQPDARTIDALRQEVRKAAKGQFAPPAALAMMELAAPLTYQDGLAAERALFVTLRASAEAKALRRLFLAERDAGRLKALEGVGAKQVQTIGVVGAGLMGCGIAFAALNAGYTTVVIEEGDAALARGQVRMAELMDSNQKSGRLSADKRQALEGRLTFSTDYEAFSACDLVVEAVFEDMAVKRSVFKKLDSVVKADCLLASNTSYLDLDAIGALTRDPSRFLGLHFFSPAHVMRLCEVVRAKHTSSTTLATGVGVARKLGKIPIVTGVCEGFCGNRILKAYRTVAETMVEDGAAPEMVDSAMTGFGFPMGPFAVQDMAGLEIAYANRKLKPALRPDGRPLSLVECLVEAGRLGCKNGAGWYRYDAGARSGTVDPAVSALIAANVQAKNLPQRSFNMDEIREALLAAMAAEGQRILDEGIVSRAEDIDLVLVHGYGFPAHKGGPMFLKAPTAP